MKILDSYKKIAKSMLVEYAWDRKFGEPLPTLEDVMKEADDEPVIRKKKFHVGKGVYVDNEKDKDNPKAQQYKKDDSGKYVKIDTDDKAGDDSKKDDGGKLGKGDFDRDMGDDTKDDNTESDDVEISDANSGPIDRDDIMDMLKNDSEIMDKIGTDDDDDLYWDGLDLVSSKMDDQTVASIDPDSNMTLGDLKKQIMDYEEDMDETKTINGVKYRAIKESVDVSPTVIYPFKKTYKKIGGK